MGIFFNRWDSQQGRRFFGDGKTQEEYDKTYTSMKGYGASSKGADAWAIASTREGRDAGEGILAIITSLFSPIGWTMIVYWCSFLGIICGSFYISLFKLYPKIEPWVESLRWFFSLPLFLMIFVCCLLSGFGVLAIFSEMIERSKFMQKLFDRILEICGWICFISFWGWVIFISANKFIFS